jgi:hypothetical protein
VVLNGCLQSRGRERESRTLFDVSPSRDPSDDFSVFGKQFAVNVHKDLFRLRDDIDRERALRGPTKYSQTYFNEYIHIMVTISIGIGY